MDAELNAKHSTESAPGALKRGVRALHKGSPPKPPPSRPRGDGCASTNEAECQSEAKERADGENPRCAARIHLALGYLAHLWH